MEAPASRPDPQTASQPEPYNPYHSLQGARLTNETVADFLQRLPPAQAEFTIPAHLRPPWYWIANPNRSAYLGGRADTGDVTLFTREGQALLAEFRANIARCARNAPIRTQLREVLKGEIAALAKRCGVTVGKWMLFPKVHQVNEVWRQVCEGVDANRLGIAAKVSTSCQVAGDTTRLICVYTKDFTDVEDVKRVLHALVEMGLVAADIPMGIRYKCDAYTYLNIYGENEYGLPGSVYGSKEMLAEGRAGRDSAPVAGHSEPMDVDMTG